MHFGVDHLNRNDGSRHGPEECAFLARDEALLFRKAKIGGAFGIGLQARPVGFVGSEAVERDQPISDAQ